MNEILHANIFFIIASIATVVFSILVCFILYYVLKIVKSIRSIVEKVEAGSEAIAEDMVQVRAFIANGGMVSRFFKFIMGAGSRRGSTRRSDFED